LHNPSPATHLLPKTELCKKKHAQKYFEAFKLYRLNNNKYLLLHLSDKSSDVSLWFEQILVSIALKMQE